VGRDISWGGSDCRNTALSRLCQVSVARRRAGRTCLIGWETWIQALHKNAQVPVSLLACYSCTQALCSNINTMTLVCSRPNRVSSLSPVGSAQGRNQSEMTVASWCNPRQGSILSAVISKRISDPLQQTLHRKYPAHYVKSYSVYAADINCTVLVFGDPSARKPTHSQWNIVILGINIERHVTDHMTSEL